MEQKLAGYVLNALDASEREEMEHLLRTDPTALPHLEVIRRAIEPLAADREISVPSGLAERTLARVRAEMSRDPGDLRFDVPPAPVSPARTFRPHFRRMDVLVAACLLLLVSMLLPPALSYARYYRDMVACKNNLHGFQLALADYSTHHDGRFPDVASITGPPRNVAGMVVPLLREEKRLPDNISVSCPSNGSRPADPWTVVQLAQMSGPEFEQYARSLSGCYAYTLGFADEEGTTRGLREDMQTMPIMADRPPRGALVGTAVNSPNHAGRGQNVLFVDGHCSFFTRRTVGPDGDDIFLNLENQVKAGRNRDDAVLGASESRP